MPQIDKRNLPDFTRSFFVLMVWLLLGLQVLAPLVHAHTQAKVTHGGFHLPEFQQHDSSHGGWAHPHLDQNDGMAVGVAQGAPQPPHRWVAEPQSLALVPVTPFARVLLLMAGGSAWMLASPTGLYPLFEFSSPPAQAPPFVLL